jgi:hypothetical protein
MPINKKITHVCFSKYTFKIEPAKNTRICSRACSSCTAPRLEGARPCGQFERLVAELVEAQGSENRARQRKRQRDVRKRWLCSAAARSLEGEDQAPKTSIIFNTNKATDSESY